MRPCTAILLAALVVPAVSAGQMYRWVDKDGRVHYTQTPPPGLQAQEVAPAPAPKPRSGGMQRYLEEADAAQVKRNEREAQEQTQKQERETACSRAENTRQKLTTQPLRRLTEQDESGQIVRMTPEKHAELLAEAEGAITKNCGPGQ